MNRRPVKSRKNVVIQYLAQYLNNVNILPNHISLASIVFSTIAGFCLILPNYYSNHNRILYLGAAIFILIRLLCNVLDGIVAIEYRKKSNLGGLYNDLPDRISDFVIFVGAGYGISVFSWGVELGLVTAWVATMTAYVRVLGVSLNTPENFNGPMAKQHRMACMILACSSSAIFNYSNLNEMIIISSLIIISIGCIITCFLRLKATANFLENCNE